MSDTFRFSITEARGTSYSWYKVAKQVSKTKFVPTTLPTRYSSACAVALKHYSQEIKKSDE